MAGRTCAVVLGPREDGGSDLVGIVLSPGSGGRSVRLKANRDQVPDFVIFGVSYSVKNG